MKCFWCGTLLNKKTKTQDHLVSRPLAAKLKIKRCQPGIVLVVPSCSPCNGDRALITAFYVTAIKNSLKKNKSKQKARAYLDKIRRIRKLIVNKLHGYTRHVCLLEIDTVLKFIETGKISLCGRCCHLSNGTMCDTCLQFPANFS